MEKSSRKGGMNGLIAAGRQLEQIKAQARALGIFTDDRELLECPSCGLLEDVTPEGLLVTYPKDRVDLEDCGLRFEQVSETSFACPSCGGQDQGGDFVSALPPSARRGRPLRESVRETPRRAEDLLGQPCQGAKHGPCPSARTWFIDRLQKFAKMIDRHWEGIAAYCRPENKVSLGFVEGLNNKIRVIQRRAYGLRDEEYLRLKVLTCMLPAL